MDQDSPAGLNTTQCGLPTLTPVNVNERPAASIGHRPQGLHCRIHAEPVGTVDREAAGRNRAARRSALFGPRPGDRRQVGAVVAIMGVIDALFAPRLLKKLWDEQDAERG